LGCVHPKRAGEKTRFVRKRKREKKNGWFGAKIQTGALRGAKKQ